MNTDSEGAREGSPLTRRLADVLVGPLGGATSAGAAGVVLAVLGYEIGSVLVGIGSGAFAGVLAYVIAIVTVFFATHGMGILDEDLHPVVSWAIDLVPVATAVAVTLLVSA